MMVAYKTYPHVDMAATGRRTAALLDKILTEGKPATAHRQLDFLIPLSWQCTMAEPSGPLYDRLTALEVDGVWSTSYLPGFDRTRPVSGTSVTVSVELGDLAILKKQLII